MHRRRLLVPLAATTALACAVGLSVSGSATAGDDGRDLLRSGLVGSTPPPPTGTGPTLFGVRPGNAPWVVDHDSSVRVRDDGRVDIKIRGLVIPPPTGDGTNPVNVATVSASVVCNGGARAADKPMTAAFRIDRAGDARIRDHVDLPEPCLAPAVLVHPNGTAARYIAANGS